MKLYKIANWSSLYENNRTRELKKLDWVPMPNKQDGDGYTIVMSQSNGAALLGAWMAIVQIASRCGTRGTLLRDGGKPHDSVSLSRMSRVPEKIIEQALDLLCSDDVGWMEVTEHENNIINPASGCGEVTDTPPPNPASWCLEGKGREGKGIEGKGKTEADMSRSSPGLSRTCPGLNEVFTECEMRCFPRQVGEEFWNHFESTGWNDKNGHAVVKWQPKLATWFARWREQNPQSDKMPEKPREKTPSEKAALERRRKEDEKINAQILAKKSNGH